MSEQYIVSGSNGFIGEKVESLFVKQYKRVIGLCRNADVQKNPARAERLLLKRDHNYTL